MPDTPSRQATASTVAADVQTQPSRKDCCMQVYHQDRTVLTVVFDRRVPEQREALDYFRGAFAETADLEALNQDVYALHIRPGAVRNASVTGAT